MEKRRYQTKEEIVEQERVLMKVLIKSELSELKTKRDSLDDFPYDLIKRAKVKVLTIQIEALKIEVEKYQSEIIMDAF